MTPRQREKLQAAADYVSAHKGRVAAATIILGLISMHGATRKLRPTTNTLRCAGVAGSCTWSTDTGLLDSWLKNAAVRLAQAALERITA